MNYAHAGHSKNTSTVTDDKLLFSYDRDLCDRWFVVNEQARRIGDSPEIYLASSPIRGVSCPTILRLCGKRSMSAYRIGGEQSERPKSGAKLSANLARLYPH